MTELTHIWFDATPGYLSGTQTAPFTEMQKDKHARLLYTTLCELWEKEYSWLRPTGGASYTESNEAFPFSGPLSVDREALARTWELAVFNQAWENLVTAQLISK